jgi:hypothetical protein
MKFCTSLEEVRVLYVGLGVLAVVTEELWDSMLLPAWLILQP